MRREIVCLANSRKPGGNCVAGKDIKNKQWIRPVSNRAGREISGCEECIRGDCQNDSPNCNVRPQVGDVISIDFIHNVAEGHHVEDILMNRDEWWEKIKESDYRTIESMLDSPFDLWGTGSHSSNGLNDKVPDDENHNCSLYFIKPDSLKFTVTYEWEKLKVRGTFKYNQVTYKLTLTDRFYENFYMEQGIGSYEVDSSKFRLCISLTNVSYYDGYYKLIAGIVEYS